MSDRFEAARRQFPLRRRGDFSFMAIGPHPGSVAEEIEKHARRLDADPLGYLTEQNGAQLRAVFDAIAAYFAMDFRLIATTHSTTMGLAQVYAGLTIRPGDEILTSTNEHFTTSEALRLRQRRDVTSIRTFKLFEDSRRCTAEEMTAAVDAAITPRTRVLALTWVYSTDGVKLPVRDIAAVVRRHNSTRSAGQDAMVFVVDGVHGFGVEDFVFDDNWCDVFVAGCHKWMFGPRGTAVIAAKEAAWQQIVPIVPSFSDASVGIAQLHIPGGIWAYEHLWALDETFNFHMRVGKAAIQGRTHALARQLKEGLARTKGVDLRTPIDQSISSGIVCFDIPPIPTADVIEALAGFEVQATETGIDAAANATHVRLAPSILHSEEEVDDAIEKVARIAREHQTRS